MSVTCSSRVTTTPLSEFLLRAEGKAKCQCGDKATINVIGVGPFCKDCLPCGGYEVQPIQSS